MDRRLVKLLVAVCIGSCAVYASGRAEEIDDDACVCKAKCHRDEVKKGHCLLDASTGAHGSYCCDPDRCDCRRDCYSGEAKSGDCMGFLRYFCCK